MFLHALLALGGAQAVQRIAAEFPAGRPERHLAAGVGVGGPDDGDVILGQCGGVRHDDQRRLQALRAVDRHDAHEASGGLGFALHLRARAAEPVQEALQGCRQAVGVGDGGVEQFVHRFGGLGAETGEQPSTAAQGA